MPLRNDLLNPIHGDNPSGANLRYDPVTEKIKEARREDVDAPQGQWKTALKTAELPVVIKTAGDVLANRSKDLQIAVWLVDAHVRREAFPVLAPALRFLRDLLEQFWDTLYPPIDEDGDMEVRAAPLAWLGEAFGKPGSSSHLGFLPIVSGKLNWNKYVESRKVGYEKDADTYEKQQARQHAITDGKLSPEQFDEAAEATPVDTLRNTYKLITEAKEALEGLIEYCDTRFGNASPSFVKTRDTLEEIADTVRKILIPRGGVEEAAPEPEPEPEEVVEAPVYETPAVSEEPVLSMDAVSTGGAAAAVAMAPAAKSGAQFGEPTSREDVARQLASICRFLRTKDPSDPTPYFLARSFAWAPLLLNAPSINPAALLPPPSELRLNLKRLANDQKWDEVLDLTESALLEPYGSGWLDLQRYAMSALENNSLLYTAMALRWHIRMLIEALPNVQDVILPDDTPSANADTKNWIENFIFIRRQPSAADKPEPAEGSESTESSDSSSDFSSFSLDETPSTETTGSSIETTPEPEAAAPAPEPEPEPYTVEENPPILEAEEPPPSDISDEFGQALAAVKDGRTAEGLAILTAILATERSGRARFRRRTQLAHLLMAAGKGKVAQPMLDQLASEIDERRLEDWEPGEAIAYPLELLLHCLSPADERRTQLYTRICKLDPVRAVNCSF